MRIAIIGAGYVGLVTGITLANRDHSVTFVELSEERRSALKSGRVPIFEPGLHEALQAASDRVDVVDTLARAGTPDLVLVAVGTPIGQDGMADESQLFAAAEALRHYPSVDVTVRSTLSPGRSVTLPRLFGRPDGRRISTNPEFLRQGSAMDDFANPSRIVIGRFTETSPEHLAKLETLYAGIPGPRLVVGVAAAELIKNVANAFLALKLSFVNEVASLAEEYAVDVEEVLGGIGLDPRIGSTYMRPGLGFGGSCLPKELEVLSDAGRRQGLAMHIARAAALVNAEQQDRFARRLLNEVGPGPARIGVLGLSFKANTDDLRGSPAITVVRRLLAAGHTVVAHDPAVSAAHASALVPGIEMKPSPDDVFEGADAVAVTTDWPQFASLNLASLRERVRTALLYDGRNFYDPAAVTAAGFSYRGIGRPPAEPSQLGRPDSSPAHGPPTPSATRSPAPTRDGLPVS